jgi:hypothetical protein
MPHDTWCDAGPSNDQGDAYLLLVQRVAVAVASAIKKLLPMVRGEEEHGTVVKSKPLQFGQENANGCIHVLNFADVEPPSQLLLLPSPLMTPWEFGEWRELQPATIG